MSITTEATYASPSRSARSPIARIVLALVAALALTLGVSAPSYAATGAQTGEWDILALSASASPRLQSYNHSTESWDTVPSGSASFAVGSGKLIDGDDETATSAVSGGGIRFKNTAATTKTAAFTITVPNGTGLSITDVESGQVRSVAVSGGTRTITLSSGAVAAGGEGHRHYTWQFSGSSTAVTLSVSASVSGSGAGNFTTSSSYDFTF
ncbi:hypothetical protein QE410_001191 [Microbacterium sp. SORGH_AS 1204]|uniref:hypothetical protein n=1 Tax=Microbacterium sp. SORGH_AS_1204 TaxID=3041785 RepID=UPI00278D7B1F|nr:hypothetical protein [Microbacterium sp. SORGH_AS_1204]MDQ1136392.1 hypothetical protein [Microbacterium sp. SORGH_AS_1204]